MRNIFFTTLFVIVISSKFSLSAQSSPDDFAVLLHLIENKEEGNTVFNILVAKYGGKDISSENASVIISTYGDAKKAHNKAVYAIILATGFKKIKRYKKINDCYINRNECSDTGGVSDIISLVDTADKKLETLRDLEEELVVDREREAFVDPALTAVGLIPSLVQMVRSPAIKKREMLLEVLKNSLWEPVKL